LKPLDTFSPIYKVIVTRRTYALGKYEGVPVVTHVGLRKLLVQSDGDMSHFLELLDQRDLREEAETAHPTLTRTFSIGDYRLTLPGHSVSLD
jgi:hypothetical protein